MYIENGVIKVSVSSAGAIEEKEIPLAQISAFGYFNRKCFTKKGDFRKWIKCGYIIVAKIEGGYNRWNCSKWAIDELKQAMKGQYKLDGKHTEVEQRYVRGYYRGERKATNWDFKVIKNDNSNESKS